jgi:hypothetical protein
MDPADKEKKHKKQLKRMGRILAQAWELDNETQYFQDDARQQPIGNDNDIILCLTAVGTRIDNQYYRLGKHGWQDFCRDLGGVYARHANG